MFMCGRTDRRLYITGEVCEIATFDGNMVSFPDTIDTYEAVM